MQGLSISDQLIHSTIRIECSSAMGSISVGTGFFFAFLAHSDGSGLRVPGIVTNRHVLEGASRLVLHFSLADAEGRLIDGRHIRHEMGGVPELWLPHPDPNTDLAVLPLGPIEADLRGRGLNPYTVQLGEAMLPTPELLSSLRAMEEIVMVGYPNGLWDEVNNTPLFRRGITATPLRLDYQGKPEFVIDAACYPGSSGSPVLLINEGSWASQSGLTIGSRAALLGILYAGPQYTTEGDIVVVEEPMTSVAFARLPVMLNLGYCVKAAKLLELENALVDAGAPAPSDWIRR